MKFKKAILVTGKGLGEYPQLAFNKALENAGINKYNLIKFSGVLPKSIKLVKDIKELYKVKKEGDLLYIAYTHLIVPVKCKETIGVAIAVAIPKKGTGLIVEYNIKEMGGLGGIVNVIAKEIVRETMKSRNRWEGKDYEIESKYLQLIPDIERNIDNVVDRYICIFAGCVLF